MRPDDLEATNGACRQGRDVTTGPGASEPQPSLEDCLRLIGAVMAFEPSVYLFGGVAEDAMLHGSWVRPHDDIDVLVERADLPRQLENAHKLSFGAFETRYQPLPATPVVVGSIERGLNLEISVVDRSSSETPFFYMVDERDDVVRVELTDGIFGYAPCMLDGIEVRTVSPIGPVPDPSRDRDRGWLRSSPSQGRDGTTCVAGAFLSRHPDRGPLTDDRPTVGALVLEHPAGGVWTGTTCVFPPE